MPGSANTIKEYLVELGFHVDEVSMRKFKDGLKISAVAAENIVGGMAKTFVIAGGAVAAALTAVGAGLISLGVSAARKDLEYQMFARRMFIGADAARSMKIALDALGVSVEELIWGPPEVAERYQQLIKDQRDMIRILGGDTGEKALRKIRDIEFQFTRMGPEIQRFGIRLTEDVLNKLFGRPDSLENRLKDFNEWFKNNIPAISDKISNVLAPAFRTVWDITKGIFNATVGFVGALDEFLKKYTNFGLLPDRPSNVWSRQHPGGLDVDDSHVDPIAQAMRNGPTARDTPMQRFARNHPGIYDWMSGKDWKQEIRDDAAQLGIDPDLALAIAQKESGINANAPRGGKGEIGMFQLMPGTVDALRNQGIISDPGDPSQNIWGGLNWLLQKKGKGSWQDAVRGYNGSGPAAQAYEDEVWRDYMRRKEASAYAPGTSDPSLMHRESYSSGNITVQIMGSTGMNEDQIKRAVREGIDESDRKKAQRAYAQRLGAFA